MNFALRLLKSTDVHQVVKIERQAFPTLWPPTTFKQDLNSKRILLLVATRTLAPDEMPTKAEPAQSPGRDSIPQRMVKRIRERLWPEKRDEDPAVDTPLGFASVWFLPDEAHLTVIAVEKGWQGQGLGELLLIGTIEAAIQQNSRVVTLEARVSNYKAISLYQKYGFTKVGIRKRYYSDNREDAVIMTTDPIHGLSYQKQFAYLREVYLHRRGSVVMTLGLS